jgi:hypothetical protein
LAATQTTQAEACATQCPHTPQRDSTRQADIGNQIDHSLVKFPG